MPRTSLTGASRRRPQSAPTANTNVTPLIDLSRDTLHPVRALCERKLGRRPSPPTLWRWLRGTGVAGVQLQAVQISGVWHTTEEALADFLRRVTAAKLGEPIVDDSDPPAERPAETERALRQRGLAK